MKIEENQENHTKKTENSQENQRELEKKAKDNRLQNALRENLLRRKKK